MLYPDLMSDYVDSCGMQWFIIAVRDDNVSLWASEGYWWAVCEDGVFPSDADAIVLPQERAETLFYS